MKIAFFDFDGTLTKHDTLLTFAKFCVGRKRLWFALIKSLPMILLWKARFKTNSQAKEALFGHLYKGMKYIDFQQAGQRFIPLINDDIRKDIVEKLLAHKRNGDKVVIVSASILEWILPWAEQIGVDAVIATQAAVDKDGRLTGMFSMTNCHGAEKAVRIKQVFPDIADYETWAYGDSSGDTAMLALVNHPKKV